MNLGIFDGLELHGIHAALGFGDKEDVLHGILLEGDCPVGRVVAYRSRNLERLREFRVHGHFVSRFKLLCEACFYAFFWLFGVAVSKDVVGDMLFRKERLVKRGVFLGGKDIAIVCCSVTLGLAMTKERISAQ